MKKNAFLVATLVAMSVTGTPAVAKKVNLTPMEIQALQSREFKAAKDTMFSSVMSVFQDLGYQVSSADMGSGFITAQSANKNKTSFFEAWAGMSSSGGSRVTAFVETMPSGMSRVRLNFMNTKNSSGRFGGTANDKPILEPKTYQVAFERIEQALFERGALTKAVAAPTPAAAIVATPALVSGTTK